MGKSDVRSLLDPVKDVNDTKAEVAPRLIVVVVAVALA